MKVAKATESAVPESNGNSAKKIPTRHYPQPIHAWYMVGILTLAYVLSFMNRQILTLLVGPIKADLRINDTQMSLLMGFSFAIFYAIFGLPLGRLADSKSRRTIIAIGIAFWSLMAAACGMAQKYWHLFLFRMGLGAGEATLSPCAFSLISDSFPKEKRAGAISVYCMGIYIGSGFASIFGGMIVAFATQHSDLTIPIVGIVRPWQLIFFILGIPGILFSLLIYTFKEPSRMGVGLVQGNQPTGPSSIREVFGYIRSNSTTFFCHFVGFALLGFSTYGTNAWLPTLFTRRYEWSSAEAGIVIGSITAVFGTLGVLTGGRLCDWLTRKGYRDATMRVGLFVVLASLPIGMVYPLMPTATGCIIFLIPTVYLTCMPYGISNAAIQEMIPATMRGQISAIYLFIYTLVALGLGPTGIALFTDYVFCDNNAIHYSITISATLARILAAILLFSGMKSFVHTLNYLKVWNKKNNLDADD
jgi:MFS family permease